MTRFHSVDAGRGGGADRQSRSHLLGAAVAVALLAGIAGPVAALGGALQAGHRVGDVGGGTDPLPYALRLDEAFALAQASRADATLLERVTAVARKSDRLAAPVECGAQTWPDIHPPCLVSADGIARAPARTVTVEYRIGERSSVLVRLPASRLAVNSND